MSRIVQSPVNVPPKVVCQMEKNRFIVQGEKGTLSTIVPKEMQVHIKEDKIKFSFLNDQLPSFVLSKELSMIGGTVCRHVQNMIVGVSQGFFKSIELVGVGYKAEWKEKDKILKLSLGYSHDIFYNVPEGISVTLEKPTLLKVAGIDKQKVGQVVSEIVRFRPPEPYKGKGVCIVGQYIRRKEGKRK